MRPRCDFSVDNIRSMPHAGQLTMGTATVSSLFSFTRNGNQVPLMDSNPREVFPLTCFLMTFQTARSMTTGRT